MGSAYSSLGQSYRRYCFSGAGHHIDIYRRPLVLPFSCFPSPSLSTCLKSLLVLRLTPSSARLFLPPLKRLPVHMRGLSSVLSSLHASLSDGPFVCRQHWPSCRSSLTAVVTTMRCWEDNWGFKGVDVPRHLIQHAYDRAPPDLKGTLGACFAEGDAWILKLIFFIRLHRGQQPSFLLHERVGSPLS